MTDRQPVLLPKSLLVLLVMMVLTGVSAMADEVEPRIDELRAAAYEHQMKQQWCDAKATWRRLLEALPAEDASLHGQRREAEQNLQLLEPLCRPEREPVDEMSWTTRQRSSGPQRWPSRTC